jgi:hypothetical protein
VRCLFLTHRYLGIAVSLLMVTWCLSGVVMMYVSYPSLLQSQRLAALSPLDLSECCQPRDSAAMSSTMRVNAVRVEMVGARAVALLYLGERREVVDLMTGDQASFPLEQAAIVARGFAAHARLPAEFHSVDVMTDDQWTVSGDFGRDRPLYKFSWNDADRTELYVSSATGQAVQLTTSKLRFWNWFGAVPHWVYFTALRRHALLWSWFVVAMSMLGCFLTAIGIVIGIQQLRQRPSNRLTPYRGFMMWHHIPGVIFGGFALTWVLSGLLSLNPWGFLESDGAGPEADRIHGVSPSWRELQTALRNLSSQPALRDAVSLQSTNLDGRLFFVAAFADGRRIRLDADGMPAPLTAADLALESQLLAGNSAVALHLISAADSFYFPHHGASVSFPVHRLLLNDRQQTAYYLDPVSGEIVTKIDREARGYRWMYEAPHRLDFSEAIRNRPTWDILMLFLLSGASLVCATGLYGAIRRVSRRPRE